MSSSCDYLHPGKLFTDEHGRVTNRAGVLRYAAFLRTEAGLDETPPVDLVAIFNHFGISSREVPLVGPAGLSNPHAGFILINSNDPLRRQRFSKAHELIELLFAAQSPTSRWSSRGHTLFSSDTEEKLCEEGAAELLMPRSTFLSYVHRWGVSLESGKRLAELYKVSLYAAMIRAVRLGPGQHAFVRWKLSWKPSEKRSLPQDNQMSLFEDFKPQPPPKKLRVHQGYSTQDEFFIPTHKSVDSDTSIYRCYEQGKPTRGVDWIDLASVRGYCYCESMPVRFLDEETDVLSVIHLPDDEDSVSRRPKQNH